MNLQQRLEFGRLNGNPDMHIQAVGETVDDETDKPATIVLIRALGHDSQATRHMVVGDEIKPMPAGK